MRFITVATSLLASAILAESTSTALVTDIETITSCPPDVKDCPGRHTSTSAPAPLMTDEPLTSTALVTEVETITSCPPDVTDCPLRTKTSTLISTSTPSSAAAAITAGAVIVRNGTSYSVYEASTITVPCSSCATVAAETDKATVTVTQSICSTSASALAGLYPEMAVSNSAPIVATGTNAVPNSAPIVATGPAVVAPSSVSMPVEETSPAVMGSTPAVAASSPVDTSAASAMNPAAPVYPSSVATGTGAPMTTGAGGYSGIPFTGQASRDVGNVKWTLAALVGVMSAFALF